MSDRWRQRGGLTLLLPGWPAPARVRACVTTRLGGVSQGPYTSLNLADHVGDDPEAVARNRRRLTSALDLPAEPVWLEQVHGVRVLDLDAGGADRKADAAHTRRSHRVCAVLTADCLPVLLCDRAGSVVAAAHAGWRGLRAGVLEATIEAIGLPGERLLAWLGPAIGPEAFEVGPEVREAFMERDAGAATCFRPAAGDRLLADLYGLARRRLGAIGVRDVFGGGLCTFEDGAHFFSYRRDGATGRMASLIWLSAGS